MFRKLSDTAFLFTSNEGVCCGERGGISENMELKELTVILSRFEWCARTRKSELQSTREPAE